MKKKLPHHLASTTAVDGTGCCCAHKKVMFMRDFKGNEFMISDETSPRWVVDSYLIDKVFNKQKPSHQ